MLTSCEEVNATAYKQLVWSVLEYAPGAWESIGSISEKQLETVQEKAAPLMCGIRCTGRKPAQLMRRLNLVPLTERRQGIALNLFRQYHLKKILSTGITRGLRLPLKEACAVQYLAPYCNPLHHQLSFFNRTLQD